MSDFLDKDQEGSMIANVACKSRVLLEDEILASMASEVGTGVR